MIANNQGRKGKTLWTAKTGGAKVTVRRCENEEAEARFAADTVLDHVARGGRYGDFAVLYRMHAQSNAFEKAFISASVPYKIIGGLRFYDRKEIKDLMAYLSLIANRADNLRLERILNEPKRGIGDATLGAAREIAGETGLPLFDIFEHADEYAALGRKAAVLKGFTDLVSGLAADAEKMDLDELFDEVCERTGYAAMLKAMGDEGEPKTENLGELKTNILKYMDAAGDPSLSGFLEETALLTDIDRLEEGDAVLMMTVHSAKGLEFPQVFAVGMEESIFPGMRAVYEPAELEEERRLAYVAMTRAKERLYLTAAASRMLFGQTARNRLSRFVAEIADGLTDFTDETAERGPARQSYHFGDEDGIRPRPDGRRLYALPRGKGEARGRLACRGPGEAPHLWGGYRHRRHAHVRGFPAGDRLRHGRHQKADGQFRAAPEALSPETPRFRRGEAGVSCRRTEGFAAGTARADKKIRLFLL